MVRAVSEQFQSSFEVVIAISEQLESNCFNLLNLDDAEGVMRAVLEQFQSNIRAVFTSYQSDLGFQLVRAVLEHFQSSSRALSEQFYPLLS